ncbi:MAG: TIGR01244 family phosphatase, partial [Phenylobacterium sp.]|nr:TIGR01244 family phosphatase [Phenylobacterium sp.]
MSEFHRVTERLSVAPQLAPEDMAAAAAQGFKRVVCNRPDGEGPGQPTGAEMKAAAQAAGLEFVHIPFAGMPDAATADAVFAAVSGAAGPVLAYCRSGTRSVTAW